MESPSNRAALAADLQDTRARTHAVTDDLTDEQLLGPELEIVNPPLWELGHVAWFQERWLSRHLRDRAPLRESVDQLYDSIAIPHDARWDLPLLSREGTRSYLDDVLAAVLADLGAGDDPRAEAALYLGRLVLFHEDMHGEAFTYTRQTHGWAAPPVRGGVAEGAGGGALPGDVRVRGRTFQLGATGCEPFVFDNEKWAHPVRVETFRIARAPVTQAAYAEFVDDGGYRRPELWGSDGATWLEQSGAQHPLHWRRADGGGWERRDFADWVALEDWLPVHHLNWFEANAWCRWAGRRLPTEAEWELAACGHGPRKRTYPWGDEPPDATRAHTDARANGPLEVGALPDGDGPYGCRQLLGNVWEWTASVFAPYPGFVVDPYVEYSEPWFHTRRVLRGGAWATPARMLRNTWRNYFTPDRRDVLSGFRTCAP